LYTKVLLVRLLPLLVLLLVFQGAQQRERLQRQRQR
jgi:hypothetical protein